MMQASSGNPMAAKQGESLQRQVNMFLEGTQSGHMGLSLNPAGLGLRFALHIKPGTDLAKQMKVKPPAGSLLEGLPAGRFMLAWGQVFNAETARETLKQLDPYFEAGKEMESIDPEQLGALRGILEEWAPLTQAARATAEVLTPSEKGLVGLSMIFDTSNSGEWLGLFGKAIDGLKKVSTDEEVLKIANAVSYQAGAEDVAGKSVAHLKLNLAMIEDVEEEDREEAEAVLGKEGVLFRFAAVNPQRVVVTFGGGADYMTRLIEQAQTGAAPLDNAPSIQKVGAFLPKEQVSAAYLAVDQIVAFIENVAKAVDEDEPLPFRMPEINAPAALASAVGPESAQTDIFLPTELVVAVKDVVMSMLAPTGAPGPGPGEPTGGGGTE
jgi:hypothetical protein